MGAVNGHVVRRGPIGEPHLGMLMPGPEVAAQRLRQGRPSDPLLARLFEAHGRMHDGKPVDADGRQRIVGILGPSCRQVARLAADAERRERAAEAERRVHAARAAVRERERLFREHLRPRALQMVDAIARADRVPLEDLLSRRPRYRITRDLAIWTLSRMAPALLPAEIGSLFSGLGPEAIRAAVTRHQERSAIEAEAGHDHAG